MPYSVNFTDKNTKSPILVGDSRNNDDTSLTFPGRNVTGYGTTIAENFLHLLENFASASEPVNPVEGQLWYKTSSGTLMIFDNNSWKAAGSIQKSSVAPDVAEDKVGEIWVDTVKQQLYIWSGQTWVLVGPQFSSANGLRTGPVIETIDDSDNVQRSVIKFLVEDVPVSIISKDSFVPKISIPGYISIKSGINIISLSIGDGSNLPKLYGTASNADALNIGGVEIPASRFLRTDTTNTTEYGINIRNNSGITLGVDGTFKLFTSVTSSKIYNANPGSSLDLQTNRDGEASTIIRIIDNRVGINAQSPQQALDVDGNIQTNGSLIVTNTDSSTNFSNGSIRTAGGAAIGKNLLIGQDLSVDGTATLHGVVPKTTDDYDLGTALKRWDVVYAKTIQADFLNGVLQGDVAGNARSATNLRTRTTFRIKGDITSQNIDFDGSFGGNLKEFETTLTSNIIESKPEPFPNKSKAIDEILVFRSGSGLLRQSRDVFIADLGVPIGTILPFAGLNVPDGYLYCDGSEVERSKYSDLYDIIGNTYGVPILGVNTFKLPDLRGRFPLGRDNMDNGSTVPNTNGGFVDAGGGAASRIPGTEAGTLGGSAGSPDNTLEVRNLPEHEHNMRPTGSTVQFAAVKVDSAVVPGVSPGPGYGPTAPGQAQYLNSSGGVKTSATLATPFSVLNPYLTINYIIRSGPPAF